MCGTDYNKNIRNCGPVTCYKLIRQYKSLESSYFNNMKMVDFKEFVNYEIIYEEFTNSTQQPKLYYLYNKTSNFCDQELLEKTYDFKIPINVNFFFDKLEKQRKRYCININIFEN